VSVGLRHSQVSGAMDTDAAWGEHGIVLTGLYFLGERER